MPAFAPLALPTPVTVAAFEPVSNVGILSVYAQSMPVVTAALAASLTVSLQRPTKTSKIAKSRQKFITPTTGMVNGVATGIKDREVSVDIIVMSSERSTDAERDVAIANAFKAFNLCLPTHVNLKSIW